AWINLALVIWFAHRAGHAGIDDRLRQATLKLAAAGLAMGIVLWFGHAPLARAFATLPRWHDLATLLALGAIAGVVYGAIVVAMFGATWLAKFRAAKGR